jgi:hypothetical protein
MVRPRRVKHPVAGLLFLILGALASGCATPARDSRDPEVWRPAKPASYPLPR